MNKIELYNEDCLIQMDNLEKDSIDLILTDPPYNLGLFMKNRDTNLSQMRDNFFGNSNWDHLTFEEWAKVMEQFFLKSSNLLRPGGTLILFMSIIKIETIIKLAEKHNFYYKTTGIWHKKNPMPRNMNLHFVNSTEAWIYFTYKTRTGTFNNEGKLFHDFVETSVTSKKERKYGKHPTQKPEKLMQHFIELLTKPGDTILDPFMGSGTTGVVAKKMGRNFIGIETDNNYFDMASNRIKEQK